jgi:hypothetical protein
MAEGEEIDASMAGRKREFDEVVAHLDEALTSLHDAGAATPEPSLRAELEVMADRVRDMAEQIESFDPQV